MRVKASQELFDALTSFETAYGSNGLSTIVQNDIEISTKHIVEFLTRCTEIIARKKEEVDRISVELNELSGKVMLHIMECNQE